MNNAKSRAAVSRLQVLQVISDRISLDILNQVGKNEKTSEALIKILGITPKQYYSRSSRLLKSGLVKRKSETLSLTSFGKLILQAQAKIAKATHYSWKLKVIDALASDS